jgi:predicted amidohydrolase YtcJ
LSRLTTPDLRIRVFVPVNGRLNVVSLVLTLLTLALTGLVATAANAQSPGSGTRATPITAEHRSRDASATPQPAGIVFRKGAVYTIDAVRSWAEAVAVLDGRIVYVGSDAGVTGWIGPATRCIDLDGKMLLPGFHDSHVHLVGGGIELSECNINGMLAIEPILAAVRDYAVRHPDRIWIRGGGWPLTLEEGNPHKSLLDYVIADRPVMLDAFDGHSIWVNSKALELAGITKETLDPPRGRIERDPGTGEPTGTLREAARDLVISKIPPYVHEDYVNGLRRGMEMANRFGITSVQEASVGELHLNAFAELDRANELTVRTVAAMRIDPAKGTASIPQFVEWRQKFQGKHLRATAVKIFQDGVIESRTSALLEPYLGGGDDRGWLNFEPEVFKPLAAELDRLGFQIHIHAIGDRAIRSSFDALEFARKCNGSHDSRHHLAHIELVDPVDLGRFRQLGVIANVQPFWASADLYIVKMTEPVLGPERSRWLYPIRSIANTGAVIACGSDWSVSSMNPLDAIQIAVTRRGLKDGPGPAWIPDEVVELPVMLAGYTINGAFVNFAERETGSIEVGKAADLIVLSRNLFEVPKHEIHGVKVLLTLLEGREVYRDASLP